MYSTLWGSRITDANGSIIEEFIDYTNLVCINDRRGSVKSITLSVLTIMSNEIAGIIIWEVLNQSTVGIDHYPIIITIGVEICQDNDPIITTIGVEICQDNDPIITTIGVEICQDNDPIITTIGVEICQDNEVRTPRWKLDKADWQSFQMLSEFNCVEMLNKNITEVEEIYENVVKAITEAAEKINS